MNTVFEWQKQQVDERVQGALKNAASYRLAKEGSRSKPLQVITLKTALGLGVLLFLLSLLLSACNPSQPANAGQPISEVVAPSSRPAALTMADRIRFQDNLAQQAPSSSGLKLNPPAGGLTMSDRIRFQDRLAEQYLSLREVNSRSAWTMTGRMKFHDRLEK
jgi:predicted small secreted protein